MAEALDGLELASGRVRVTRALPAAVDVAAELARSPRLLTEGHFYEAIAAAAAAVRALPSEPLAYERLAVALQSRGRLAEAEAALRTGLDLRAGNLDLRHRLALVLQGRGQLGDAIREWQRNLELEPDHGPSHARLAVAFFLLGDERSSSHHRTTAARLGHPAPAQLELLADGFEPAVRTRPAGLGGGAAPVRMDTGGTTQAAETIVASGGAGQSLVAGWNDLRQAGVDGIWRLGVAASSNGGASWTDRILRAPAGLADDYEGDPMVAHDPRTGNQWVGGVLFGYVHQRQGQLYVARRQPGTNNFFPAVAIHGASFIDKPLLAAGPRPGLPNTTRLYTTYNLGLQSSDDLGATWSTVRTLAGGLGLQPRVGPNGEVYVLFWDVNLDYEIVKSTDGGVTFGAPRVVATRLDLWSTAETNHVPGSFRVAPLAYLAVDPTNGTLYVVYPDSVGSSGGEENVDLFFTRSVDGGLNWTTPRVINGDSTPPRDQFHPWLEVGADGRLHLAFLDTRSTSQLDADPNASLDVYYSTSTDGGDSWTERRVTPQPFQSQFAQWPGFDDQFVGDYIGLSVAAGRVHLAYPSTVNGNLDVFSQVLDDDLLFADGFESGNLSAWSTALP